MDDVWFENFAAWARAHPAGRVDEGRGWRTASLASPWPFYNVATAVSEGFPSDAGAAELDAAFALVPGYRVWLRDGMDRAEVALRRARFEVVDEVPGLWMPLTGQAPIPAPPGYVIKAAETDAEVVECMLGPRWEGYMNDLEVAATFPQPEEMAREGDRRFYIARRGERFVATGQTVAVGGVVGIHAMWTDDVDRRRGVGGAVLSLALAEAAAAGNEFANIQAAPAGIGIYRRAGFKDFGKYRVYRPPL